MLSKEIFSIGYIYELQSRYGKDPSLLERTLFAFGLLEALVRVEMPFIFKGGSSLMLILERPARLSTDIDIIVEPGTDVEGYIEKASKVFPFIKYEEQHRIGKNKIEKKHFKFTYPSPLHERNLYILLDVVYMKNPYASLQSRPIKSDILLTDDKPMIVTVPSVEGILGDKMTAFAPHTTGIPLGQGKDLEVIKQLHDVAILMGAVSDKDELVSTYDSVVSEEIAFRNIDVDRETVLRDTIRACTCIIGNGATDPGEYQLYINGAQALSNHVLAGKYGGGIAAVHSCMAMHLAAIILKDAPIMGVADPESYSKNDLSGSKYKRLSFMQKQDATAYGHLVEAVRLLDE